jgi:anti-anti-sigma regulatory factor
MIDFTLENMVDGALLKTVGELTIENAESLKTILIQALEGTDLLSLDLAQVGAVDIAGLQLLCSAHKTASRLNKELVLPIGLPEALEGVAVNAGYLRQENCIKDARGRCLWRKGGSNG